MRLRPRLELSATQLIATALAAITATVAASYLGVAGTVIGAAVVSVVSAVGNALYTHSLRTTHARVRGAVPVRRRAAAASPVQTDHDFLAHGRAAAAAATTSEEKVIHTARRRPWRAVALGSVALFTALLAVVTGIEIVSGQPISDLVRGSGGSGTTLFGDGTRPRAPAPTVTQTVTPSVVVVTPTVTQTAPAVTKTATPTVTPTPTPSGSSPSSGTPSPSGQPTG
jgi:hypothetical protein